MLDIDPSLRFWSWSFLSVYLAMMIVIGFIGMRRVKSSDDFATARASYGPIFLALALSATTASGGTFIGLPALAYEAGLAALWYAVVYPIAIYIGVILALRAVRRAGERFGNRSMPEYLGDRFQSDALRVIVAVFSLMLMFYLAAQLLSGAILFTKMMGIELFPALLVTAVILLVYIVVGGAHADIMTDGVQGALMLLLAVAVVVMVFSGYGVAGGYAGVLENLHDQDPNLTAILYPGHPILGSWWAIFAIAATHAPVGLLPHIGNKLWALRSDRDQRRFIIIAFACAALLSAITLSGLLARAVLGDVLLSGDGNPNDALPMLFIALMPPWLAGLIGASVLAAVMSTADGLLVSTSQIFANDIYRRTLVPRMRLQPSAQEVDRVGLKISRVATIVITAAAIAVAWVSQSMNIAVLVWTGIGGLSAALAGPMFVGILWRDTTRAGALAGFISGGLVFVVLKSQIIDAAWFASPALQWLAAQGANPFACATLGGACSIVVIYLVSLVTEPPDAAHLAKVFDSSLGVVDEQTAA
jgi:SSS family transporter